MKWCEQGAEGGRCGCWWLWCIGDEEGQCVKCNLLNLLGDIARWEVPTSEPSSWVIFSTCQTNRCDDGERWWSRSFQSFSGPVEPSTPFISFLFLTNHSCDETTLVASYVRLVSVTNGCRSYLHLIMHRVTALSRWNSPPLRLREELYYESTRQSLQLTGWWTVVISALGTVNPLGYCWGIHRWGQSDEPPNDPTSLRSRNSDRTAPQECLDTSRKRTFIECPRAFSSIAVLLLVVGSFELSSPFNCSLALIANWMLHGERQGLKQWWSVGCRLVFAKLRMDIWLLRTSGCSWVPMWNCMPGCEVDCMSIASTWRLRGDVPSHPERLLPTSSDLYTPPAETWTR